MTHAQRMIGLLRIFSARGHTLEYLAHHRRMKRAMSTLKMYCRRGQIAFPDYTPRSMRGVRRGKKQ
jgi:hypothetical protein